MIIQIEDYNAVVNGLRAQLQLQRQLTQEKVGMIEELADIVSAQETTIKVLQQRFDDLDASYQAKLDACESIARGPRVTIEQIGPPGQSDIAWSAASDAVYELASGAMLMESQRDDALNRLAARAKRAKR